LASEGFGELERARGGRAMGREGEAARRAAREWGAASGGVLGVVYSVDGKNVRFFLSFAVLAILQGWMWRVSTWLGFLTDI